MVGFGLCKKLVSLINCDGLEINFLDRKFFILRKSEIPPFKFNFHFFCPCGHLLDYPLPNVDNCGHLVNHHLPYFVHVVIERPLAQMTHGAGHCLEYLLRDPTRKGQGAWQVYDIPR